VADVEAVAVQAESLFAIDATFLSKADSEPSDPTLDFRVATADFTSLSAVVRVANSVFSRRKRFCGARLTSMSWSTMPFQSKPDARPDNAIPAIKFESESSGKTLENSQTFSTIMQNRVQGGIGMLDDTAPSRLSVAALCERRGRPTNRQSQTATAVYAYPQ
jgi:hypothetical protein